MCLPFRSSGFERRPPLRQPTLTIAPPSSACAHNGLACGRSNHGFLRRSWVTARVRGTIHRAVSNEPRAFRARSARALISFWAAAAPRGSSTTFSPGANCDPPFVTSPAKPARTSSRHCGGQPNANLDGDGGDTALLHDTGIGQAGAILSAGRRRWIARRSRRTADQDRARRRVFQRECNHIAPGPPYVLHPSKGRPA